MKKIIFALLTIAMVLTQSSCVSSKKIHYFQGADTLYAEAQKIVQQYEMRLKPADQILVKVTCADPDLLEIFSQDVTMGAGGGSKGSSNIGSNTGGSLGNAYGYTLTNDGYVLLPACGKVYVDNMTTEEAARAIENKIKELNLIQEPTVTVRLMNARVTVVGAAKSPHVVSLTSERNTIVDVLAQCGDIDDTGLPKKIRLFREAHGERKMYALDMTNTEVFNSPAFYVQQNDMIYIEPNKSKNVKASPVLTYLGATSSILGLISGITALVLTLKK